jgi:hypothetical protein
MEIGSLKPDSKADEVLALHYGIAEVITHHYT